MRRARRQEGPNLLDIIEKLELHSARKRAASVKEQAIDLARRRRLEQEDKDAARSRGRKPPTRNRIRISEVQKVIKHRYGGPADTDDADPFFLLVLPNLMTEAGGPGAQGLREEVLKWRDRWVPCVPVADAMQMLGDLE